MKRAIVVGSGAGGATVAKELQGKYDVTVLEAGRFSRPFALPLSRLEQLKWTGLFWDERSIQLLFPTMRVSRTSDQLVLVRGSGPGGSTLLSAGNALRQDGELRRLGIDLDAEFSEIYQEIPVTSDHRRLWRESTQQLFQACQALQLQPTATPKLGDYRRCTNCGQCVLGCRSGAKWDSRRFLDDAIERGARLVKGCRVERLAAEQGRVIGVQARLGGRSVFYPADLVVLAAGGLGTPVILQRSGIACAASLFVDPVLCVATRWPDCRQNREIAMPFVVQQEGFILSPYFDHLSFFFNRDWRHPAKDILSLMIKLQDTNSGSIQGRRVSKSLTAIDRERLQTGRELCQQVLQRLGVKPDQIFYGTINAGHPGGMLPLSAAEAETLHHPGLPENVYVADATLLPAALGNPPILTIIALAKRVSKLCLLQA